MFILSLATALILAAIALLHLYWFLGGLYGLYSASANLKGDEKFKPSKAITFSLFFIFTLLSVLSILLALSNIPFKSVWIFLGYTVSVAFIARAIGDFRYVGIFKKNHSSDLSKKDTWLFSPLCLLLGIAFMVLSRNASL
jgi:hypothetical protein